LYPSGGAGKVEVGRGRLAQRASWNGSTIQRQLLSRLTTKSRMYRSFSGAFER
jgi:hypothetical protein